MVDPYNNQEKSNIIDFTGKHRRIEHVDSSTIVEHLELTPEIRAEFEAMGYTFDDDDLPPEAA
jgi:hypothetical protein